MDAREKNRAHSTPAVKRGPHPILIGVLVVSLIGNAVLAGLALRGAAAREVASTATPSPTPSPTPKPGEAPLSFDLQPYAALGSFMAESNHIPWLQWTPSQFDAFQRGLKASYEGHTVPMDDESIKLRDQISAIIQKRLGPSAPATDPIEEYFKSLREKEHVEQTKSGLHYRITEVGHGEKPDADATVVVSYAARLPTGESLPLLSRARVRTAVKDLLPGLAEGVQLLMPGGKALVYLPPSLSFGNGSWPPAVPKGAPIIFFLELHDVTHEAAE